MAVLFQDVGTMIGTTSGTTLTPVVQTHSVGNLLIAVICVKVISAGFNTPSGWTSILNSSTTAFSQGLFYRVATGSDSNPVFTFTSAEGIAQIVRFSGTSATAIGAVGGMGTGSSATHTSPAFTSTAANSLAVAFDTCNNVAAPLNTPAGWTSAVSQTGIDLCNIAAWTEQLGASGSSSGAISVTETNARFIQVQVELLVATAVDVLGAGGCL
jgi:hypothetical protein